MRTCFRIAGFAALLLLLPASGLRAETYRLTNGDQISGEVLELDADRVVLAHAVLGRIEIPLASVAPPDAEPVNPGLFGTDFLRGWERSIEAGITGSHGNSSNQDLHAGIDLAFADATRRWLLDANYFLSRSDHETSKHNARTILERDWLRENSKWFWFANGRWDWDQFEAWDHRVSAFGGAGRELIERENFDLRARFGLGLTQQFGDDSDLEPELSTGLEASWQIREGQTLSAKTTLFPDLSDPGEFRNVTRGDWKVKLNDTGLALKLSVENEYESRVDDDAERNDLRYYGSLVVDF